MLLKSLLYALLTRLATAPWASAMFLVGVAVIAAQLYAVGTLAQGQVQRAQLRDSLQASANQVLANCVYYSKGSALNACRTQGVTTLGVDSAGSQ